jgi:hypothetical protein
VLANNGEPEIFTSLVQRFKPVNVKGGMELRNGMRNGLRNGLRNEKLCKFRDIFYVTIFARGRQMRMSESNFTVKKLLQQFSI